MHGEGGGGGGRCLTCDADRHRSRSDSAVDFASKGKSDIAQPSGDGPVASGKQLALLSADLVDPPSRGYQQYWRQLPSLALVPRSALESWGMWLEDVGGRDAEIVVGPSESVHCSRPFAEAIMLIIVNQSAILIAWGGHRHRPAGGWSSQLRPPPPRLSSSPLLS